MLRPIVNRRKIYANLQLDKDVYEMVRVAAGIARMSVGAYISEVLEVYMAEKFGDLAKLKRVEANYSDTTMHKMPISDQVSDT
jgi:hypothetical protein